VRYENGVTEINGCTVYSKYGLISLRHGHSSLKRVLVISGVKFVEGKDDNLSLFV
jgi:hypothetical protein